MADATGTMASLCGPFGGLDYGSVRSIPSPSMANFALSYKEYACNGPRPVAQPSLQSPTEPMTSKNIPQGPTIAGAKQKCDELGFEAGSEAYGKCVLKLSK